MRIWDATQCTKIPHGNLADLVAAIAGTDALGPIVPCDFRAGFRALPWFKTTGAYPTPATFREDSVQKSVPFRGSNLSESM